MSEVEPSASSLSAPARRTVAWVAGLNGAGFLVEAVVACLIGSAALLADATDFLEDFLINALVFAALGWSVQGRRKASYGLAALILLPALAALGVAARKIASGEPPQPIALSLTALGAMLINLVCALLLLRARRAGGALLRGAWLAARNDVAANLLIVAAGFITIWWWSPWPDVAAGVIIGVLNLSAAREVFEQSRAADPAREIGD